MGNMYVVMSKLKDRISTDNKHMIKYIMRKIVLSLFALCCFSAVMAQQKTRSLSVELLGAQTIAGINYDSRFEGNSGLGYRVGIGYGYGENSGWFDQKINGVGVPLELNYLLGKKNSKLELGFGASLGVYQVKETIGYVKDTGWYPGGENTDETSPKIDFYTSSKTQFGYFKNILELDATGINNPMTSTNLKEVSRYTVNGKRLTTPTKGINVVKYSNGMVKKELVK